MRLDVREVEATFPAGELRLAGGLGLFGQDVTCDGVTGAIDGTGTVAAARVVAPAEVEL